jgi:hypothetical protein
VYRSLQHTFPLPSSDCARRTYRTVAEPVKLMPGPGPDRLLFGSVPTLSDGPLYAGPSSPSPEGWLHRPRARPMAYGYGRKNQSHTRGSLRTFTYRNHLPDLNLPSWLLAAPMASLLLSAWSFPAGKAKADEQPGRMLLHDYVEPLLLDATSNGCTWPQTDVKHT